jgi:hypothetical protein
MLPSVPKQDAVNVTLTGKEIFVTSILAIVLSFVIQNMDVMVHCTGTVLSVILIHTGKKAHAGVLISGLVLIVVHGSELVIQYASSHVPDQEQLIALIVLVIGNSLMVHVDVSKDGQVQPAI